MKMGHGQKLGRRKEAAIIALLIQPSLEKAAAQAGIAKSTLWNWLQLESFQAEYREAKKTAIGLAVSTLQRGCQLAAVTLLTIVRDVTAPAGARVRAAQVILEMSFNALEIDEIIGRLEQLEKSSRNFEADFTT